MLFSTYQFIFVFLPVAFLGYLLLIRTQFKYALVWLNLCSIAFYGYWNPKYLALLLGSITFNYFVSGRLGPNRLSSKRWVVVGVAVNLSMLIFFKYTDFLLSNFSFFSGDVHSHLDIILPLGISFFTFQQISYIVDMHRESIDRPPFYKYLLCITFFPHLIAGPLLHFKDILPQVRTDEAHVWNEARFGEGLALFSIGLFKKLVLADPLGAIADAAFLSVAQSSDIGWIGALRGIGAYTGQIYLDFSGYSDMALGLGLLFGIRLPQNFYFPYLSFSIVDFWRRWHMTLSRFLKNYLYIILLGGNRCGILRRNLNLILTMLLGGLWHGAGWTFVIWGGLHGLYLLLNHSFRQYLPSIKLPVFVGWGLTLTSVMFAWIFFRADSLRHAIAFIHQFALEGGSFSEYEAKLFAGCAFWIWIEPYIVRFRGNWWYAAFTSLLAFVAVLFLGEETAFIYFNF